MADNTENNNNNSGIAMPESHQALFAPVMASMQGLNATVQSFTASASGLTEAIEGLQEAIGALEDSMEALEERIDALAPEEDEEELGLTPGNPIEVTTEEIKELTPQAWHWYLNTDNNDLCVGDDREKLVVLRGLYNDSIDGQTGQLRTFQSVAAAVKVLGGNLPRVVKLTDTEPNRIVIVFDTVHYWDVTDYVEA